MLRRIAGAGKRRRSSLDDPTQRTGLGSSTMLSRL